MINKAIIPAAGLGTRLLPATRAVPKPLLPLVNIPAIDFVVEELRRAGVHEVAIVRGPEGEALERHILGDDLPDISFDFFLQEEPKGLGHAVLMARDFAAGDPCLVLLPDDLFPEEGTGVAQLIQGVDDPRLARIGLMEVKASEVSRYGIMEGEKRGERRYRVTGLVEKPDPSDAPSRLAVLGRYLIPPALFPLLEQTPPGAKGEIQLTDALAAYVTDGGPMEGIELEGVRYDVGDVEGYKAALRHFLG